MKAIFIFQDGELLKTVSFKSKKAARQQYRHFLKYGCPDPRTGEKMSGITFELFVS